MSDSTRKITVSPAVSDSVKIQPEFIDCHGLRKIFGISRSTTYELIKEGEIRSVCLRRNGRVKGRRLIDCASVRDFFERQRAVQQMAKVGEGL